MNRSPVDLMDLPVPGFGREGTFNGQYNGRTRQAIQAMQSDNQNEYGTFIYPMRRDVLLDAAAGWGQVEAFYDSTFASPEFEGFERQATASLHPDVYRIAVWSDGNNSVFVTMVPGTVNDPIQFMYLFNSQK